jgi:hypothetical protein
MSEANEKPSHRDSSCIALLSGRDGYGELSPEVIHLQYPMATCCICGNDDLLRWGVPIDTETALIVANDFEGDWAAKPACRECWSKHDAGQFVGHDPAF